MKKLVSVTEVEGEGLESLLGEKVLLMCANYFYGGVLVGVNDDFVKLEKPKIIYETGPFTSKGYTDAQPLHVDEWYVKRSFIESYGKEK